MGWGSLFDIINKVLPSREARIRNQIAETKRRMDELSKIPNWTMAQRDSYNSLAAKLRSLEEAIKNG